MLSRVLIEKPMVEQSRGSRQQVREASLVWRGVQGAGGSLRTEWRVVVLILLLSCFLFLKLLIMWF